MALNIFFTLIATGMGWMTWLVHARVPEVDVIPFLVFVIGFAAYASWFVDVRQAAMVMREKLHPSTYLVLIYTGLLFLFSVVLFFLPNRIGG
jgi:cytochrome c oxidase assembly factor CtaG